MQKDEISEDQNLAGTFFAVLAFSMWGILPVFWKLFKEISPFEIVAHRVVWTCLFTGVLILVLKKRQQTMAVFKSRTQLRGVLICALLLSLNWLTYVYAVNSNHVLDASMGYYINPLISVFLGLLVLRERVNSWQKIAILLAGIGVFLVAFQYGKLPWIALTLAFTFGFYGLVKKTGGVNPIIGLAMETFFMVPFALVYILLTWVNGAGALVTGPGSITVLLVSTGMVTAIPLLFFAAAAQKIPLSRVGFIQYLTPTCFFLLGRFAYQEAFSTLQLISFIFIWCALALYSFSNHLSNRKV